MAELIAEVIPDMLQSRSRRMGGLPIALSWAAAAWLSAAPAGAQMQLVGEEAVTPGARACLGLSSDVEPTRKRLAAEGWSRGKFQSADGKALRDPGKGVEVYGKEGLLLVLTVDEARPGCVVTAKALPGLNMTRMVAAATAVLGKAPFLNQPAQAMWRLDTGQAVMLRHSNAVTGASIQIVFTPVQKKI